MAIEPDSPADEAGLLPGDQLITKFEDWKPGIPLEINVNRKEDSMKISITPDEKGKIGADFIPIPFFIPRYTESDITTLSAFLQFILINVMTFGGCFIGYEMVKRINWLRPMFGIKPISIRK
jgi:hypothetical protein